MLFILSPLSDHTKLTTKKIEGKVVEVKVSQRKWLLPQKRQGSEDKVVVHEKTRRKAVATPAKKVPPAKESSHDSQQDSQFAQ